MNRLNNKRIGKRIHGNRLARRVMFACRAALLLLCMAVPASATGLGASNIVTGTNRLLADVMGVVTVLCPTVCGLFAIGFAIRRGMSDEQDGKMWNRRIVTAVVCGVGGGLLSGLISLIASYY